MRIEKLSPTVFTPLDDGTGVLLNLDTLVYYSLNRAASLLWQELGDKKTFDMDGLIIAIRTRFDVDQEPARREVEGFLRRLEQLGVIRVAEV